MIGDRHAEKRARRDEARNQRKRILLRFLGDGIVRPLSCQGILEFLEEVEFECWAGASGEGDKRRSVPLVQLLQTNERGPRRDDLLCYGLHARGRIGYAHLSDSLSYSDQELVQVPGLLYLQIVCAFVHVVSHHP